MRLTRTPAPLLDVLTATGRARRRLKKSVIYGKLGGTGMSGPIAADGGGPLERDQIARQSIKGGPERTSSTSIGRGRSICEYDEIMQILPGSSDNTVLINAPRVICNLATVRAFSSEVETGSR
jgi:hypothetical protein